jgi:hypothetical protein
MPSSTTLARTLSGSSHAHEYLRGSGGEFPGRCTHREATQHIRGTRRRAVAVAPRVEVLRVPDRTSTDVVKLAICAEEPALNAHAQLHFLPTWGTFCRSHGCPRTVFRALGRLLEREWLV